MMIVCLARAYNSLWFSHQTTFLYVTVLFILLLRDVLWCRIIFVINCDADVTSSGRILFCRIRSLSWWKNRQVALFVSPADYILCLCAINQLHDTPLASRSFHRTINTLIRTLLHHISITLWVKEFIMRQVSMEGRIHWWSYPFPPQAYIALPDQNQILKLVPLWEIFVSLVDGPTGVDVP